MLLTFFLYPKVNNLVNLTGGNMKKLLLGALAAGLFMQDADAGLFNKNKMNETQVHSEQKTQMGHNYTGMVNFAEVLLTGWSKALSEASKKSEFKKDKNTLQTVSKQFKTIAEYMTSILTRKVDIKKKNKAYDAVMGEVQKDGTRKGGLMQSLILLNETGYWKEHHGNHLRFSILMIRNALTSLTRYNDEYQIAGVICSPKSSNKGGFVRLAELTDNALPNLIATTYTTTSEVNTKSQVIDLQQAFEELYTTLWSNVQRDISEDQYI